MSNSVNQGFLWNISDPSRPDKSLDLLCMEGNIFANPLINNPKVKELFEKAQICYVDSMPLGAIGVERLVETMWSEVRGCPDEYLTELHQLSSATISTMELAPTAKKLYEIYHNLERAKTSAHDIAIDLLVLMLHFDETTQIADTTFHAKFQERGVALRALQTEDDQLALPLAAINAFAKLIHNPVGRIFLKQLFSDPSQLKNHLSLQFNSWNQGDVATHATEFRLASDQKSRCQNELDVLCPTPEEQEKAFGEVQEIVDQLLAQATTLRSNILSKLPQILQQDRRAFVALTTPMKSVVEVVSNLGLQITQVTIPMKPVGFFWKLKDAEGRKAYILGTMHLAPAHVIQLNSKIQRCFAKASAVSVEVDITRPDVVEAILNNSTLLKAQEEEKSSFEAIDPKIRALLLLTFKLLFPDKTPAAELDEYQTYLFYKQMLYSDALEQIGYASGIELDLIPKAKEANKSVCDLETVEDQLGDIADVVEWAGDKDLLKSIELLLLENLEKSPEEIVAAAREAMVEFRKSFKENLDFLANIITHGYRELLLQGIDALSSQKKGRLTKRNMAMALKISDLMQTSNERYFHMVGALHLPGQYGIIKLLEQSGISVKRIQVLEPL